MKVVILAGGRGTRLSEETEVKPKPLVEIGGRPILWHIMKHYAQYDCKDFYIALGYKGYAIKKFFLDYYRLNGSMSLNLATGDVMGHKKGCEDWMVHLIDTGIDTNTGGRIKRLEPWLQGSTFMVTYGDGVSSVDIGQLLEFHRSVGKIATITAVRPPARFGGLVFNGQDGLVQEFTEKPQTGEGWINGGFGVFEPAVFDYMQGDETILESQVLEHLARDKQLAAYRYEGFWQCMDTLRDLRLLQSLWQKGNSPWKSWTQA